MKSTIQTLAFLAALSTTASAAISLGVRTVYDSFHYPTSTDNVAWISGEDPCSTRVTINPYGQNPCGIPITLNNGYTYFEQNCGGNGYSLVNSDGSFNSECVSFSDNDSFWGCVTGQDSNGETGDVITQSYVCG